jgi:hypothetical protein
MRTSRVNGFISTVIVVMLLSLSFLPCVYASSNDDSETKEAWTISRYKKDLPMAIYRASAVWTGEKAYIFSGRVEAGPIDTVIEFDPSEDQFTVKTAIFPRAREMATAAWLPPYAYIFGGSNYSDILDEVIRYDSVRDVVTVMPDRMPDVKMGASAIPIDDAIYIIGGRNQTDHTDGVYRYYPGNGTFQVMPPSPVVGGGRAAMATDKAAYLFGGCGSLPNQTSFRLDPSTGTVQQLDVGPNHGYYWATGVWTGSSALVFGGNDFEKTIDQVLEFHPEEGKDGTIKNVGKLPKPLELATSVYDPGSARAFIFGGRSTEHASKAVYVVEKGTVTDDVEVTPQQIMVVVLLMAFVIVVVIYQSYREKERDAPEEEGNGTGTEGTVPVKRKKV